MNPPLVCEAKLQIKNDIATKNCQKMSFPVIFPCVSSCYNDFYFLLVITDFAKVSLYIMV